MSMYRNVTHYYYACMYMAKTEMFDRTLTDLRSPFDKTEAYVIDHASNNLSNRYASMLRKELPISLMDLRKTIRKHRSYNAQQWIDEYKRLEIARLKGGLKLEDE